MPRAKLEMQKSLAPIAGAAKKRAPRDGAAVRKGQWYPQEEIDRIKKQRARVQATGSREDKAALDNALTAKYPGLSRLRMRGRSS